MNRSYAFGPYVLDPARRTLLRGETQVALTARAFDVLLALVERAGSTVDKDVLLQQVWPDAIVEEANLSQQIFTIRRQLCQSAEEPYIVTVPRRGYRFVAAVEHARLVACGAACRRGRPRRRPRAPRHPSRRHAAGRSDRPASWPFRRTAGASCSPDGVRGRSSCTCAPSTVSM